MCSGGGLFDLKSASAGGNELLSGAVIAIVLCGHGELLVVPFDNGDTLKFTTDAIVVGTVDVAVDTVVLFVVLGEVKTLMVAPMALMSIVGALEGPD